MQPINLSRGTPRRLCVLLAAAALGGCDNSTAPVVTTWRATLVPVLPYTVSGRAAALTQAGRTQISITIEDADAEVPHAWRVESGTCADPGDLQGGLASYPTLVPSMAGAAEAEASIASIFRSGQSLIVRVIRSPEGGPAETAACAQLEETT